MKGILRIFSLILVLGLIGTIIIGCSGGPQVAPTEPPSEENPIPLPLASPQTFTINADAHVRYGTGTESTTNYGTAVILEVKDVSPVGAFTRKTYLKFDLTSFPHSGVASAKLRIYGNNATAASTATVQCYGVNSDAWTETTITGAAAPAYNGTVLSSVSMPYNTTFEYWEFDVSSFVHAQLGGDKIVTLLLQGPDTNQNLNANFRSKEHTDNKPAELVLQ